MEVYQFQVKDQQIDMTYKNGFISYVFEKGGKSYGQKVKVSKRGIMDLVSIASLLVINAIETIEALEQGNIQ